MARLVDTGERAAKGEVTSRESEGPVPIEEDLDGCRGIESSRSSSSLVGVSRAARRTRRGCLGDEPKMGAGTATRTGTDVERSWQ